LAILAFRCQLCSLAEKYYGHVEAKTMIAGLNVRATSGDKLIYAAENYAFFLLIVFCIVFLFGTIGRAAKQYLINDEILLIM
jgi:hypothetical protein